MTLQGPISKSSKPASSSVARTVKAKKEDKVRSSKSTVGSESNYAVALPSKRARGTYHTPRSNIMIQPTRHRGQDLAPNSACTPRVECWYCCCWRGVEKGDGGSAKCEGGSEVVVGGKRDGLGVDFGSRFPGSALELVRCEAGR